MFKQLILALLIVASVWASCPNHCSAHGSCGADNKCTCWSGYLGSDCSLRECPFGTAFSGTAVNAHYYAECSEKGICDREAGQCTCFEGYEGKACQRMACPNSCSGHGVCRYISDVVDSYTKWDAESVQTCVCDKGYTGPDCSLKTCPTGDDPLTTGVNGIYKVLDVNDYYGKARPVQNKMTMSYTVDGKTFEGVTPFAIDYTGTGLKANIDTDIAEVVKGVQLNALSLPNELLRGVTTGTNEIIMGSENPGAHTITLSQKRCEKEGCGVLNDLGATVTTLAADDDVFATCVGTCDTDTYTIAAHTFGKALQDVLYGAAANLPTDNLFHVTITIEEHGTPDLVERKVTYSMPGRTSVVTTTDDAGPTVDFATFWGATVDAAADIAIATSNTPFASAVVGDVYHVYIPYVVGVHAASFTTIATGTDGFTGKWNCPVLMEIDAAGALTYQDCDMASASTAVTCHDTSGDITLDNGLKITCPAVGNAGYILFTPGFDYFLDEGSETKELTYSTGTAPTSESEECSNRGVCNRETGLCECFSGYRNGNCNVQTILF
eukprot:TRINITY_DN779879_c0_g1_i1.p1 TRINITY_DN779879_c0_g1~~TRINITY_DN779879_c0_g1_i1.p1  ORF type:complete len:565 (+),score=155.27 TRINITY_DN779879_c0_g1_i1:40-1695(+)